jgi:hypothetical protein
MSRCLCEAEECALVAPRSAERSRHICSNRRQRNSSASTSALQYALFISQTHQYFKQANHYARFDRMMCLMGGATLPPCFAPACSRRRCWRTGALGRQAATRAQVLLLAAMKVHCFCKALGPGSGCSAAALLPAIRSGLGYLVRLVRARVLGARRRCAPAASPQRVGEAP